MAGRVLCTLAKLLFADCLLTQKFVRHAGSPDVFEFLSAWSDIYAADAESSFLKAFASPFTDVKSSVR